jgi:hypothetical protein
MAGLLLIHSVWLKEDYVDTAETWRTREAAQARVWAMLLGTAIYIVGAVLIYERGREAKPWIAQGVRFGILLSLVSVIYGSLSGWDSGASRVGGEVDGGRDGSGGGPGIGDRPDLPARAGLSLRKRNMPGGGVFVDPAGCVSCKSR